MAIKSKLGHRTKRKNAVINFSGKVCCKIIKKAFIKCLSGGYMCIGHPFALQFHYFLNNVSCTAFASF